MTDSALDPAPSPGEDDEFYEVFRGLRADPEAFAAGVRERIEELEERGESAAARFAAAPARLRWAASILPPGLVAGATSAAGLAGKKLGLKVLPGLLALPAITFLVLIGAFVGGLHALRRNEGLAQDAEGNAQAITRQWWQRNRALATVSFVLLLVLALLQHTEVFSVLIGLSMLQTVLMLGELARAGLADRAQVARTTARLLGGAAFLWFYLRDFLPTDPASGPNWVGAVVLGYGAVGCLFAGRILTWRKIGVRIWFPDRRMLYPDPVTTNCLRGLYGLFAIWAGAVILFATGLVLRVVFDPGPSRARLVAYAETFEAPLDGREAAWEPLAETLRVLERDGGVAPDLTRLRQRVSQQLADGASPEFSGAWPLIAELGLLSATEAPALMDEVLRRDPRERSGGIDSSASRCLHILLGQGALSSAERAELAAAVDRDWPAPEDFGALRETLERVRLMDALVGADWTEARREQIQQVILAHWRGATSQDQGAAFSRESPPTSRGFAWRRLVHLDNESTQAAVALMERMGTPEGVDLAEVRDTLRLGAAHSGSMRAWVTWRVEEPYLDLALWQLELLAPRSDGLAALLLRRRVLFGSLLLVLLCLVATLRAPRKEELA